MERGRNYYAEGVYSDACSKGRVGYAFVITNFILCTVGIIIMVAVFSFAYNIVDYYAIEYSYYHEDVYVIVFILFAVFCSIYWGLTLTSLILTVSGRNKIVRGDMSGITLYYVAAGLSFPSGIFGILAGVFLILAGTNHKRADFELKFGAQNNNSRQQFYNDSGEGF